MRTGRRNAGFPVNRRMALSLATACLLAVTSGAAEAAGKLKAIASFSILGDLVAQVGGERVEIVTLVGPDSDAHVYEPKPDDARRVAAADIVFVNGLGFEGWLGRLLEASGGKSVVTLSAGVKDIAAEEHDHSDEADHDHDHGATDPHAWQSVPNVRVYVRNIADALCKSDAAGCSTYKANAATYDTQLQALDADIRKSVSAIPENRRIVITSHEAFGYFASEYGIRFLAPEGVSTESEASARDVARLIRQIRDSKASALFVESISDPRLIEQISRETGLKSGGALYSDALSKESGPAPNYIAMMKHNIDVLTAAMRGS